MGTKTLKAVAVFVLLCTSSITVNAATVSDVYNLFGIELTSMYPEDVLNTIADYHRGQRDTAMYKFVEKSEFDNKIILDRISDLESELTRLKKRLLDSYSLQLSEIYALEEEYSVVKEKLSNAKKSSKECSVSVRKEEFPTEEEFQNALLKKSEIDNELDIGTLPIRYPVTGNCTVKDKTETHISLAVSKEERVSPIANGTVAKVTKNSITIDHGCGIYTYYGNLSSCFVKKGEAVYQGQYLGYTSDVVVFKMKIQDNFVDVSKLFEEG